MPSRPGERRPDPKAAEQPEAHSTRAPEEGAGEGDASGHPQADRSGPARKGSTRQPAEGAPSLPEAGDLGPESGVGEEDPGAAAEDYAPTPPDAKPGSRRS